jgi:hypothetical protein
MKGVAALGAAALGLSLGAATAMAQRTAAPCRGSALHASFAVVPGSAGAGNIVYLLRVRNRTARTCFVSGLPRLVLLGRTGAALPTHPSPEHRGVLTAIMVVLKPGAYASTSARFSPDVTGTGDSTNGPCEPLATRIRITPQPGGGTIITPIVPPTPVCERGGMSLPGFVAGRNGGIP